jgi:hypothetical protein
MTLNILTSDIGTIEEALAELSKSQKTLWENDELSMRRRNKKWLIWFVERRLFVKYKERRSELVERPVIDDQIFSIEVNNEALVELARYEVHLDRKLERTLALLVKYQSMRSDIGPDSLIEGPAASQAG